MGWFSARQQASLDMLAERQRRTEEEMTAIAKIVGEIHTALVVRDPGTRLSAEAYDGLRKTVIAGATQQRAHLVQLVELSTALDRGADATQLTSMVDEWLIQAGLAQVTDARRPDLYEVLGGAGDSLHILSAAWVDSQNGALIKRGTAERVQMPSPVLPRTPGAPAVGGARTVAAPEPPNVPARDRDESRDSDKEGQPVTAESAAPIEATPGADSPSVNATVPPTSIDQSPTEEPAPSNEAAASAPEGSPPDQDEPPLDPPGVPSETQEPDEASGSTS